MTKLHWFIFINVAIIITAGIICFRNFKNLKRSLYWLIFPDTVSVWSKKQWDKDFENTFRFDKFILLIAVLSAINFLTFKYIF